METSTGVYKRTNAHNKSKSSAQIFRTYNQKKAPKRVHYGSLHFASTNHTISSLNIRFQKTICLFLRSN